MEEKYEEWGLSLSLKPPIITNRDHHKKHVFHKRYHELIHSIEKQSSNTEKLNAITKPLVIDLEEVEMSKLPSLSLDSTLTSVGTRKRIFGNFTEQHECFNNEEEAERGERKRLRLTKEQVTVLEQAFKENSTINMNRKLLLVRQVNLKPRQVEVWFQNRRARIKLKQTEAECEQLRRLCENLKEENRKLQKEVQELRKLQHFSDHGFMKHVNSPYSMNLFPKIRPIPLNIRSPQH